MHRNGAWVGQLERTERWHGRLMSAARAREEVDLLDFAFFQNCHHLQEYVRRTSSVTQAELTTVTGRPEMAVCRDLANGTKHLDLSRPSVDADFTIARETEGPWSPEPRRWRYFVVAGDDKYDLFDLASRCLQTWQEFLAPRRADVQRAAPPFLERGGGASEREPQ